MKVLEQRQLGPDQRSQHSRDFRQCRARAHQNVAIGWNAQLGFRDQLPIRGQNADHHLCNRIMFPIFHHTPPVRHAARV